MNRNELIAAIADKAGVKGSEVVRVMNAFQETLEEQISAGNDVTIPGLGKLKVVERAARTARNPITGEPVEVPAKKTVRLAISKNMKDVANGV